MNYLGNFSEDSTIYVYFTTHDTSGAAVAPSSAFEAADAKIYKDGSATQKSTTNGLTMTSPFDSITGLHLMAIDTSVDTGDAGFWATGSDYSVVLDPDETVDGQSVVRVLATFGIENRYNGVDVKKWSGTAVASPDTAGYPVVTGKSGTGSGEFNLSSGRIEADMTKIEGADATDTLTSRADQALVDNHLDHLFKTTYDPASKPGTADALLNELIESDGGVSRYTANALEQAPSASLTLAGIADAVWDEATAGHVSAGTFGKFLADLDTSLTNAKGSGFNTATDSLHAIRDYLENSITPNLTTSTSLDGTGFIGDCVDNIRHWIDLPAVNTKYTNTRLIEQLNKAMGKTVVDVNMISRRRILARFDINVVDGTLIYPLPPTVGLIKKWRSVHSETDLTKWEVWPGHHHSAHGRGFVIEGNVLRLLRDWDRSETLQLMYLPNGHVRMHTGTSTVSTANTITLDTTPTAGTFDTRANAYLGYMIRIIDDNDNNDIVQERVITGYDNTTNIATVDRDWSPALGSSVTYEVLPLYGPNIEEAVCLQATLDILTMEGQLKKAREVTARLRQAKDAFRMEEWHVQSRFPAHLEGDTSDNEMSTDFFAYDVH